MSLNKNFETESHLVETDSHIPKDNISDQTRCLEAIIEFAKSGKFNATGIEILLDLMLLFELDFNQFKHILNGAHVVCRGDKGLLWERWYNRCLKLNLSYSDTGKNIFIGREQFQGESSHPSLITRTKYDRTNRPSQFEIIMGNLDHGPFAILFGKYSWTDEKTSRNKMRSPNSTSEKYLYSHSSLEEDGRRRENTSRKLVTWFQIEKSAYGNQKELKNRSTARKMASKFYQLLTRDPHAMDAVRYAKTGRNIGPFGESIYTEKKLFSNHNSWNPLYIDSCLKPGIITKARNTKSRKKINRNIDAHYNGRVCPNVLKNLTSPYNKFQWLNQFYNKIILDFYCPSNNTVEDHYRFNQENCNFDSTFWDWEPEKYKIHYGGYKYILNPLTNKYVSINTSVGKNVLHNYIRNLKLKN